MSKFGCLQGTPSIRNYDYATACGAGTGALPDEFILPEARLPKVRDQGDVSACCAFAAAEILEVLNGMEFDKHVAFSEGFIYGALRRDSAVYKHVAFSEGFIYGALRRDSAVYKGMFPNDLMDELRKKGSVPQMYYNELCEMPEMRKKLTSNAEFSKLCEIAKKYRLAGYVGFPGRKTEEIKRALYDAQYPIFAVSESYFGESHAVIIIGWNKNRFLIQNSWGEAWGDGGRGKIPYSAVNYAYLMIDEVMELNFKDVNQNDWFYKAVKECVFTGLMNGVSDEMFEPNRALTRAEAAQLMSNLMKRIDEMRA